jgi:uncharacterized protein involved in exopolysaccharide biosynthesis
MSDGAKQFGIVGDEIDLRQWLSILWMNKKLILTITFCFSVIGGIYALSLPNIYKAQAILAPADENSGGGLSAMVNQFGGLASLAGVNLGKGTVDKGAMAIEVLKSRSFLNEFIRHREIAVNLLASDSWNGTELLIDQDLYDSSTNTWGRSLLIDNAKSPTDWDLYNAFEKILDIQQDKLTGLVIISVEHKSPVVAKNWVDWLISDLNSHIRETDVKEAQTSVSFLEKQLKQTPIADMQAMFYQLIEKQYQTIMLANVREQYMFKVVDPAVVPQDRERPKRTLLILLSIILGGCVGIIFSLVRNKKNKKNN